MIACDQCIRGLIHLPGGWANPCVWCNGTGELTFDSVAKICRVDVTTLKRLLQGRPMRIKTTQKILDQLVRVIAPKQPEMFR